MLKHLLSSVALVGLLGGAAIAQESTEPAETEAPAEPMAEGEGAGTPTEGSAVAEDQPAAQEGQAEDMAPALMPVDMADVLVSNLMDASLQTPDGEDLGSIDDAKLGADGAIETVIVSFGGFLGFGERTVELPLDAFKLMQDEAGNISAETSLTPESIENLPDYEGPDT